tara:strand:+ start:17 stop:355 length:339 start_codon:yes stop_codon:yes gene_type:complete
MEMNTYLILFAAIAFEVFGTILLPASQNFTKPLPSIVLLISYVISIYLLSILSQKLSLAIIYASWAGMGVFSVALLSYIFYNQTLNWQSIIGLFLIVVGVIIVNMYKVQLTY